MRKPIPEAAARVGVAIQHTPVRQYEYEVSQSKSGNIKVRFEGYREDNRYCPVKEKQPSAPIAVGQFDVIKYFDCNGGKDCKCRGVVH